MGLFPSKTHLPVDGRCILLTGGSQGMGKALAKQLARKGAHIVIVARDKTKLANALEEIKAEAKTPSQRFQFISADVTDPAESIRILSETTNWNNNQPPDIVWAVAGSATPGLFADTPINTLRSQMDTNYWGAAYLTHAALNLFLSDTAPPTTEPLPSFPRHIIMTSSLASYVGIAGYAPYSPAKAAMRNLADTLRNEVHIYNGARRRQSSQPSADTKPAPARDIKIHIVLPGTILSPGFEAEQRVKHGVTRLLEKDDPQQTEDEVAVAALAGLERGRFAVVTTWMGSAIRAASIGSAPRDNLVLDLVLPWVMSFVWIFVGMDLDRTVWKWGVEKGVTSS